MKWGHLLAGQLTLQLKQLGEDYATEQQGILIQIMD